MYPLGNSWNDPFFLVSLLWNGRPYASHWQRQNYYLIYWSCHIPKSNSKLNVNMWTCLWNSGSYCNCYIETKEMIFQNIIKDLLRKQLESTQSKVEPFKSSRNCWEVRNLSDARLSCPEHTHLKSLKNSVNIQNYLSHLIKWPVKSIIIFWGPFSMTHLANSQEPRKSFTVSYIFTLNAV